MTSRPRTSDLRDDLLADLRQATPPPTERATPAAAPTESRPPAAEAPSPSFGIDLRISRQQWSLPRCETAPEGWGLVLRGGPLRLRLGFSRG